MKKKALIMLTMSGLLILSGCEQAVIESPFSSETVTAMPSETPLQTSATPTAMIFQTTTPVPTSTVLMESPRATASALASDAPNPTPTPAKSAKTTPRPTKKDSGSPTPKPKSTPKPSATQKPSGVTAMSSAYKKAVLSGINYVRTHNGDYAADEIGNLDSTLSAQAQKHAEEMAARGEIFHSSWGPESVSCGDLENGENAGARSAVHAAGLLDQEITRIGVGAARSADGTIYLCVDGGK